MSRKRKCRYTPEELALHKEAVRLRNMTDKQLVEEFHRAADTELVVSSPSVAQDGTEAAGPVWCSRRGTAPGCSGGPAASSAPGSL